MLEVSSAQIAGIALLFTAGAALFALFRLVQNTSEAVRKEVLAEVDKQAALASKSRHDTNANNATTILKMDVEIERLKRETVRREDMAAIESRLTAAVAKIESKVDHITDKLSGFKMLEKQVENIDARLETAIRRLEAPNSASASLVLQPRAAAPGS